MGPLVGRPGTTFKRTQSREREDSKEKAFRPVVHVRNAGFEGLSNIAL